MCVCVRPCVRACLLVGVGVFSVRRVCVFKLLQFFKNSLRLRRKFTFDDNHQDFPKEAEPAKEKIQ